MTPVEHSRSNPLVADLALLAVAMVWGATFVMVKDALASIRPFAFLAVRFTIAFCLLLPAAARAIKHGGRRQVRRGMTIGWWLFAGYGLQTTGLQWTTAGNAAFITGLSVVFVPLFGAALKRRLPTRADLLGAVSAATGLALLTLAGGLRPGPGDLAVLGCAACFAMHIISVGNVGAANRSEATAIAAVQIGTTALLAAAASLLFEHEYWSAAAPTQWASLLQPEVVLAIAVTAVFATAGAFLVQNLAQRHTSATHTALIFSTEPAFGAIFAWLLAGEALGPRAAVGGTLILAGIVIAELGSIRNGVP
jgi:drug/metabolite transporter (DMT)-like permease